MLVLYSHINIEKALEYSLRVQKDCDEQQFSPMHQMELNFMTANIHLLNGDYKKAQEIYRVCLQSHGGQEKTCKFLKNIELFYVFCSQNLEQHCLRKLALKSERRSLERPGVHHIMVQRVNSEAGANLVSSIVNRLGPDTIAGELD
jgi:hypothetical protein